jgi:hypothetical protein
MTCPRPLLALYLSGRLQSLDQLLAVQCHISACRRCWGEVYEACRVKGLPVYNIRKLDAEPIEIEPEVEAEIQLEKQLIMETEPEAV